MTAVQQRRAALTPRRSRETRNRELPRVRKVALTFLLPLLLVAAWQIATSVYHSLFFPTPGTIVKDAYRTWFSGDPSTLWTTHMFRADVIPSVIRALAGWALGGAIGIAIGVTAGQFPRIRGYIDPPLSFIRALPKPAVVPIFLIVLGATDTMRVLLIAFGCTWPVLINSMQASRSLDPVLRDTGRAYNIHPFRRWLLITIPSAAPKIAASLRLSLSLALILMVLSEWILAFHGLGQYLIESERNFEILHMWSALLLLAVLGYLLNVVFLRIEHRLLGWHHRQTRA